MREPTNKQKAFVREYVIDLNATQGAIRAGYKPRRAKETGYKLTHNSALKGLIQQKLTAREKKTGIDAEFVLTSLKSIANKCMQLEPVLDKDGNNIGEYRFNSTGSIRALELLGKNLGLFTERIETTNININSDISKMSDIEIQLELKNLEVELKKVEEGE
jgi:phage terminase small subunit